jgi:hypothetical protein
MKLRGIAPLACIALALAVGACGGSKEATAQNAETAASYEAENAKCIAKAKSQTESRECRCRVSRRYGRECRWLDGGVTP